MTPPQGWRSWNFMKQNVSQSAILRQVDALVARQNGRPSLLDVGYSHIGIDDGWQACGKGVNHSFHDEKGRPIINLTRFPDMRAMNIQAHSKGVKMGACGLHVSPRHPCLLCVCATDSHLSTLNPSPTLVLQT